jgi:hypothetical protein
VLILLAQVINWKLACAPLLEKISGHSEPRVFKFERRDAADAKSPVVMRVKLHMAKMKNESYFPKQGWEIWKTNERPSVNQITFLPKKKIDVVGLDKSLAFLKSKRYVPKDEFNQVTAFIQAKTEQNDKTCDLCMNFRALQLTHRSSKNHTEIEKKEHRRKRDATTALFDKHLFDDRKKHDMPTLVECWPMGVSGAVNRHPPVASESDTDSDFGEDELKDGELYADKIGKEVMSVGRMQYKELKPLRLGYMVAMYAMDPKDDEEFFVGRVMAWDPDGGEKKLTVWWYGYTSNCDVPINERKYYRGERVKNGTKQQSWVPPKGKLAKNREWTEVTFHESVIYWAKDTFLNNNGKINFYALQKILARLEYVTAMIADNE